MFKRTLTACAIVAGLVTGPLLASAQAERPARGSAMGKVPSGGYFRQMRGWLGGNRTSAGSLIKQIGRGDRAQAARQLGSFFRAPGSARQHLQSTSIHDMGRLVKAAKKTTGSDRLGMRMLRDYHRFWAPRLSGDQLSKLMNMTKGLNMTQDVMIYRHVAHNVLGVGKAKPVEKVLSKRNTLFSWLGDARPRTRSRLLKAYGKAVGKDLAFATQQYDTYKAHKAAKQAADDAELAQTMVQTQMTLNMVNNMVNNRPLHQNLTSPTSFGSFGR